METRYRRADFLNDAEWLGLDAQEALSDAELRRRRDALMLVHHPDRGGSAEMAGRVNETYARMQGWLLRRRIQAEERRRRRRTIARPSQEEPTRSAGRSMLTAGVMTTALGAVAAWMLIGGRRR